MSRWSHPPCVCPTACPLCVLYVCSHRCSVGSRGLLNLTFSNLSSVCMPWSPSPVLRLRSSRPVTVPTRTHRWIAHTLLASLVPTGNLDLGCSTRARVTREDGQRLWSSPSSGNRPSGVWPGPERLRTDPSLQPCTAAGLSTVNRSFSFFLISCGLVLSRLKTNQSEVGLLQRTREWHALSRGGVRQLCAWASLWGESVVYV